jgi:NADH:ubiquinone oxidoreductase subunit E
MTTTVPALVRKIIRFYNEIEYNPIWTNKYEKCRTVKCYVTSYETADNITNALNILLGAGNIEHSTKVREYPSVPGVMSYIVRIPN